MLSKAVKPHNRAFVSGKLVESRQAGVIHEAFEMRRSLEVYSRDS